MGPRLAARPASGGRAAPARLHQRPPRRVLREFRAAPRRVSAWPVPWAGLGDHPPRRAPVRTDGRPAASRHAVRTARAGGRSEPRRAGAARPARRRRLPGSEHVLAGRTGRRGGRAQGGGCRRPRRPRHRDRRATRLPRGHVADGRRPSGRPQVAHRRPCPAAGPGPARVVWCRRRTAARLPGRPTDPAGVALVTDAFADVIAANRRYAADFQLSGLEPVAAAGLAVVTCMDSRIEPLPMLGLRPGDAKIMRNAGARVTTDVLRTLVVATHLLGVGRVMVVPHTGCKMATVTEAEIGAIIRAQSGVDVRSLDFGVVADQHRALSDDVQRIRSWPFLPPGIPVGGVVYDVDTGLLDHIA